MFLDSLELALLNPNKLFSNAKKFKEEALKVALLDIILLTAAGLVLKQSTALAFTLVIASAFIVFLHAFITQIVMLTLGGKGDYKDALMTIAYPFFIASMGLLVYTTFLAFLPTALLLGYIALTVTIAYAFAMFYLAVKTVFRVDYIRALIGVGVIIGSFAIAFSLGSLISLAKLIVQQVAVVA